MIVSKYRLVKAVGVRSNGKELYGDISEESMRDWVVDIQQKNITLFIEGTMNIQILRGLFSNFSPVKILDNGEEDIIVFFAKDRDAQSIKNDLVSKARRDFNL